MENGDNNNGENAADKTGSLIGQSQAGVIAMQGQPDVLTHLPALVGGNLRTPTLVDVITPPFEASAESKLHIESVDPLFQIGYARLIKQLREKVGSDRAGAIIKTAVSESVPPSNNPNRGERMAELVLRHLEEFPEEPKDGFKDAEEYLRYDLQLNEILADERTVYNQNSARLHMEDPEVQGKKQCAVLFECADGRNSPLNFLHPEELLKRYGTRWLPSAGVILFPEVKGEVSEASLQEMFEKDQRDPNIKDEDKLKNKMFQRLEFHLKAKVESFFKRRAAAPDQFQRLLIEFQSHYCSQGFPHHGCGAHGSNFNKAQAETIKDCLLTEAWLKEKYPKEYAEGQFRVFRSGHDTGDGGNVYAGSHLDEKRVTPEYRKEHAQMFEDAKKFDAPKIKELPDGMLRKYVENHVGINVEQHAEQTIRVSDTHYAHTLIGQSVLEVIWTDNPDNLFGHIQVLLGIIEKNFRQNGKNSKPAILHFDLIEDRPDITIVYNKLLEKIQNDAALQARLADGTLKIVATQTNVHDYLSFRLKP